MNDDLSLLAEYAARHSETAFAALVERHVPLVYSVALRQAGDPHLAGEITQTVFVILARKAGELSPRVVLPGWLCRTARYACADARKQERRRRQREQEAFMQSQLDQPDAGTEDETWRQIAPLLDQAMDELATADHDALVLRFFENRNFAEVGAALGASEDAAKMRVGRALEKLRKLFQKRGVPLSATALAATVSAHAVQSAPAGLAATIAAAAFSGTAATTAALLAATKTIAMTTLQKTAITAALVVTVGAGIFEAHENSRLRELCRTLQQQAPSAAADLRQLQPERDDATNRLAALAAELARAKSDQLELLRLRGMAGVARRATAEAAQLRAQLAQQARENGTNLVTSAMADAMKQAMEQQVQGRLSRMTATLHLTPGQTLAVSNILMRQAQVQTAGMQQALSGKFDKDALLKQARAGGDPEAQIKALLTPDQLADYPASQQEEAAHNASLAANTELTQLQTTLNLTADQLDPVYAALYDLSLNQLNGTSKPPASITNMADAMVWPFEQKAKVLAPLLTPTQLEAYNQQQATQSKLIKDMATKMWGPDGPK